jgi:hypothetical protein
MEIEILGYSLILVTQCRHNTVGYMRGFRAMVEAINLGDGYAGGSIAAANIITKEEGLNYKVANKVK